MDMHRLQTDADAALPIWLQLLSHQRARGRTGLTIPFLIGAAAAPAIPDSMEEGAAYAAFSALLLSFRDATPEGHSVVIAECVDLRQPIVARYPQEPGREDCEVLRGSSADRASRLHVQRPYLRGRKHTVESVLEMFWDRFRQNLTHGEFSFRNGQYAPFDSDDRLFVERALSVRTAARAVAS